MIPCHMPVRRGPAVGFFTASMCAWPPVRGRSHATRTRADPGDVPDHGNIRWRIQITADLMLMHPDRGGRHAHVAD